MLAGLLNPLSDEVLALANLFQSLSVNEAKAIELIHQNPTLLNKQEESLLENVTALIQCVQYPEKGCSSELFHVVLNGTRDLNAQTTAGFAAIHYLSSFNRHEWLNSLFTQEHKKVNVNVQNNKGCTPIYMAAYAGANEALALLIQREGDVNLGNYQKQTPLHLACFKGNVVCVQMLLSAGALINAEDTKKRTAIHYLAQSKCNEGDKLLILKSLIEHGLDVNVTSLHGKKAHEMAKHFNTGERLIQELQEQRVPSLGFLCTKLILDKKNHSMISNNIQQLPTDLIGKIESTARCTNKII